MVISSSSCSKCPAIIEPLGIQRMYEMSPGDDNCIKMCLDDLEERIRLHIFIQYIRVMYTVISPVTSTRSLLAP